MPKKDEPFGPAVVVDLERTQLEDETRATTSHAGSRRGGGCSSSRAIRRKWPPPLAAKTAAR